MRRVQNSAVTYIVASLLALAGMVAIAPSSASAAPGKIPNGPANFYILGGNLSFGGQAPNTQAISQDLPHPDRPPECSDGVDNEVGFFHAWTTNNPTTGTPHPPVPATDGRIDFGTATGQEGATVQAFIQSSPAVNNPPLTSIRKNTGCLNATDNLELFDRQYIAPDPINDSNPPGTYGCVDQAPPSFGTPALDVASPGCGINPGLGDACQFVNSGVNALCTPAWASVLFGNGTTNQGQDKVRNQATGGTVSGSSVSVPQANVQFQRGYQGQGLCQTSAGVTACVDLYIEFAIQPTAGITGTTNVNGSGTVSTAFNLVIKMSTTYGSQDPLNAAPNGGICTSLSPISLALTTESSGTLTGTKYDTTSKNFKVVQDPFTVAAFATNQGTFGGTGANLCSQLNLQLFGADTATAQATNGKASFIISTQDTSNSPNSSASGTGMPWTVTSPSTISGPNWNPVAAVRSAIGNTDVFGAVSTTDQTIQVNEGDRVMLDTSPSYDPAMRPFTTNTFSRTGGTAAPPPATTGIPNQQINFVAQDAPAGGQTHIFTKQVQTNLGPSNQTQQDTRTVTVNVNNVAPTASAGANRTVSGGVQTSLTGTSTDPGDLDAPGSRGYCWTQTGGASVGLPACSGSPSNNRPSSGGKFTALNFTPANANDTLTFQLVVCDKDGGCSSPSSTSFTTRAQSPSTIAGVVTDASAGNAALNAATVSLFNNGGLVATTATNASGQYSFAGLANGTDYFVSASKAGYSTVYYSATQSVAGAKRLTVSGTAGRSDIDIAVNTSVDLGSITGNVQDTSANPIASLGVRLYDENGFVASTTSDGSGSFTFASLTPKSTYKVRYNCAAGCGPVQPYVDTWYLSQLTGNNASLIQVSAGSPTSIGAQTMYRTSGPDERATISGTVLGLGSPLQSVQVRAYNFTTSAWVASALTDVNGNYSLQLLPGSYYVWFWTKNTALVPPPPAATQARSSQWADGLGGFLTGEQTAGTAKLVTTAVVLTAGGTTNLSPNLP